MSIKGWPRMGASAALLVVVSWTGSGCRAHPASLAVMVVGDAVSDVDVDDRAGRLVGQPVEAADREFGTRIETFEDVSRPRRLLITYQVPLDPLGELRYVVESRGGRISAVTKVKRNIDGVEDLVRSTGLRAKLVGKDHRDCEREANLSAPVAFLRSRTNATTLRIYDVRNFTNLRGARYAALRFGPDGKCVDLAFVGVSASTTTDPIRS